MQEEPRNSSRSTPASKAPPMTLDWISRFSRMKSAGKASLA